MSASVNEVRLVGNLGADPEIKETPAGHLVCTISVATSYRRGDIERTEWHRVVLWKGLAERTRMMKMGTSVYIAGRIESRKWEKDGVTHYTTEIIADNLQILANGRDGSNGAAKVEPGASATPVAAPKRAVPPLDQGDDLGDQDAPF